MRISTSTGDFSQYVGTVTEKIRLLKDTKFKYINLEQTGNVPEFYEDGDEGWRRLANDWGEAAAYAGKEFVVSHAPCVNAFNKFTQENYDKSLLAVRRSIEICHILGIGRIVVHHSVNNDFTQKDFYEQNKRFYGDLFDLMEKYNVMVLTENYPSSSCPTLSTGKDMRDFIEYIDHPLFAACWDTAHANLNGAAKKDGQYKCITDIGDKLKGLHISDNFGDNAHHHSWPFAGIINFDSVIQSLLDVNYDGYFNFEASYTLLHHRNLPYYRQDWTYKGETVTKLLDPPIELKTKAVDLLYDIGEYMLKTYNCFEE